MWSGRRNVTSDSEYRAVKIKKIQHSTTSQSNNVKRNLEIEILLEWATAYSVDSLDSNSTRNNTTISITV